MYAIFIDSQMPVIFDSSSISSNVTTGKPVQWKCYVRGMPPPTITWFKVNIANLSNNLNIIVFFTFRMANHCI